ncbi:MAG: hypothetical protein IJS40_04560 [Synergistaceae bacterium]|nr:hypothetical protein [Synergistaceae bacterium]
MRTWIIEHKVALLIAGILFYLYFRGIGDHGLIDNLEGVNASIAAHMFGGENYFVPKIGESLATGSTMGTWWLMALALKIFGWGEFAVRFWSTLSGLGMILISALLVWPDSSDEDEDDEEEKEISKRRSWFAAATCGGMIICFVVSQIASSHAIFSFLTSLALLGIIRAQSQEDKDWLIFSHAAIAFAFITHGPAGLFMPILAVSSYCVLCNDMELFKDFFTWPFGIITNLILSGLYFSVLMVVNPQVIFFMLCRSYTYTFGGIIGAALFLFVSFAPFHGFLIQALIEIFPRRYPAEKSPETFMLVWAMTFAAYAILSADILAIAASVPALSAILAIRLDYWLQGKMLPVRYAVLLNILILVPAFFVVLPLTTKYFPVIQESLLSLIPYEITLALFLFACWYYTKTRQTRKWVRNVFLAALICLMPLAGVFNLTSNLYSIHEIGMKIRETVQGNDIVIQYGVNFPSVYFYTLRNSKLVNAPLNPGIEEKKFVEEVPYIAAQWVRRNRIFLIIPSDSMSAAKLPNKNVLPLLSSNGNLLITNK